MINKFGIRGIIIKLYLKAIKMKYYIVNLYEKYQTDEFVNSFDTWEEAEEKIREIVWLEEGFMIDNNEDNLTDKEIFESALECWGVFEE